MTAQEERDLISAHPHSLSVTILKNIYEAMTPYFSLDEIDRKWFFNDLYEIASKEIDLFYVPKWGCWGYFGFGFGCF